MQFFSVPFFVMVAVALLDIIICNKVIKNAKVKILLANLILLVSSYAFIIYADYRFAIALLGLTLITWLCWRHCVILSTQTFLLSHL